jgi:hypothetical protein
MRAPLAFESRRAHDATRRQTTGHDSAGEESAQLGRRRFLAPAAGSDCRLAWPGHAPQPPGPPLVPSIRPSRQANSDSHGNSNSNSSSSSSSSSSNNNNNNNSNNSNNNNNNNNNNNDEWSARSGPAPIQSSRQPPPAVVGQPGARPPNGRFGIRVIQTNPFDFLCRPAFVSVGLLDGGSGGAGTVGVDCAHRLESGRAGGRRAVTLLAATAAAAAAAGLASRVPHLLAGRLSIRSRQARAQRGVPARRQGPAWSFQLASQNDE